VGLFGPLFSALNAADVRYVVVGGVAVVLHGYARVTGDVDLIVDLEPAEARKAIDTLVGLGLRARAPVDAVRFADPAERTRWIREKGLRVFSLWDPAQPMREVDLFTESPIEFATLWNRSQLVDIGEAEVRVASIADLIALKRLASRPQDLLDIAELEAIMKRKGGDGE
jgi:hypothetical protein